MTVSALTPPPAVPHLSRNAVIVGGVVLMHGVALWALNTGLLQRAVEVVVPAQILAEFIAPPPPPSPVEAPAPAMQPPPPAPEPPRPRAQRAAPQPAPKPRPPRPAPAPTPLAVAEAPAAPVMAAAPAPVAAPEPTPAPVAEPGPSTPPPPMPAPPAPAAAPVVVQPSSSAAHLNNPPPPYPAMSRRLGETGRVIVRVLIGPDGRAQDARIQRSSGFERLDQVALETARDRWRYRPGTRSGVPEAMWFNVPINFVLE